MGRGDKCDCIERYRGRWPSVCRGGAGSEEEELRMSKSYQRENISKGAEVRRLWFVEMD